MATLKGSTIAGTYDSLVKRADSYSQTGTNIELMDDSAVIQPTGLYLESGATTDNVGIGVAAPVYDLEVKMDTDKHLGITDGQSETGNCPTIVAVNTAHSALVDLGFRADDIIFATGSAERMRIIDAGVGIGNTAPGNLLEVSASAGTPVLEVSSYSTTIGHEAVLKLKKSNNATVNTEGATRDDEYLGMIVGIGVNSSSVEKIAANIKFNQDAAADSDSVLGRITFGTSDADDAGTPTERMRIDSAGNVGIGDTDPSEAKLSITGVLSGDIGIKLVQDQASAGLVIDHNANHTAISIDAENTTATAISVECDVLTDGAIADFTSNSSSTNTRNLVVITNDHASATGTTALKIEQDSTGPALVAMGNVGIGTTSPDAHLKVEDTAINSDDYTVSDDYWGIFSNHTVVGAASKEFGINDKIRGIYSELTFTDAVGGGGFGELTSGRFHVNVNETGLTTSLNAQAIFGYAYLEAGAELDNIYGAVLEVDVDGGTVDSDVYGQYINVDVESAANVAGNIYGAKIVVDTADEPAGITYGLYIDGNTGIDYGLIVDGGNVGIGTTSPDNALEVVGLAQITHTDGVDDRITIQPHTDGLTYFNAYGASADEGGFVFRVNDGSNAALTVKEDGNVGIGGATTPTAGLHVDGGSAHHVPSTSDEALEPSLRVEQNGDNACIDFGTTTSGTNRAYIHARSDRTTYDANGLPLTLNELGGHVGIGTAAPGHTLHVISDPGNDGSVVAFQNSHADVDDNDTILFLQFSSDADVQNDTGSGHFITFGDNNNTNMGSIIADSATAISSTLSDYRKKENISLMSSGLTEINNLKPSIFNFKGYTKVMNGFIAHEVQEVISGAVFGDKDAVDDDGEMKPQMLATEKLIPFLVKAVQELSAKVTALENA